MDLTKTRAATNIAWFDQMVREHQPTLLRFAQSVSGQDSDASDLVQDAYERALRKPPHIGDEHGLYRWFSKVIRNRHIDAYRASVVRKISAIDLELLGASPVEETARWRQVESATLRECIGELPNILRDPLLLTLAGHSGKEIAHRLGIRLSTVGTRSFRARHHLRRLLERRLETVPELPRKPRPSSGRRNGLIRRNVIKRRRRQCEA